MNFASLLRIHQNRQAPPSHSPNQYLLNCNRRLDNPMVYGTNNYSGIKKRQTDMMEPFSQNLFDIYQNFQENPHTQWILELQAHNVRIHKFKPSKLKLKKDDHEAQEQQVYPKISHQGFSHREKQLQSYGPHSVHPQQRKNYSPMQKMPPKTFGRNDNFIESTNQNKFSFGEDSYHALEEDLNSRQNAQNNNKNLIEERHEYELTQNAVDQKPKPHCVNLMNQFEKCDQIMDENQNKTQENNHQQHINRKTVNQLVNVERDIFNVPQQQNQPNPDSKIDFNPNVGFSFEQIDKICQPTQNTIGPVSANKVELNSQNQVINTVNNIISVKQTSTKPQASQTKTAQKPTLLRETSLKNIIEQQKENVGKAQDQHSAQKINSKPTQNPPSQQKQTQSSPHRIYCKAVIRNLTPQKFKYPRVDSKIQSNTKVKPFLSETDTKKEKVENGTVKMETDKKLQQNETEKKMVTVPSSDRLLALIDESKRLLESRTVNQENKTEDRIRRIVLHQANTNNETETPQPKDHFVSENENLPQNSQLKSPLAEPVQKITVKVPKQTQQVQQANMNSTPQRKQQSQTQRVTSPRSQAQQKPKFHNQLANMQTNYTPQKRVIQNTLNHPSATKTNPSSKQALNPVTQQFISTTSAKPQLETTNVAQQQPQNYFQPNYAYKPLNLPQHYTTTKTQINKQVPVYKPYQFNNGQMINQSYQPNTNNYQVQNDAAFQAQKANLSTNGHAVKTYSPYFPVNTVQNTKPSAPPQPQTQPKPQTTNTVYQAYTYSGFPQSTQPIQIPPSTQPLTTVNNNYIKINANYISPLQKLPFKPEQKDLTQNHLNVDLRQKQNLKPSVGLGIDGIKCVQSKIYQPSNKITTLQSDPKQSSVEFSLRIEEHFHIGNK